MLPPPIEGRSREPVDFREQGPSSRRPLSDRDYPKIPPREVDTTARMEPPTLSKMPEESSVTAREGLRKDINDLGRNPLSKGARGALDHRSDEPSTYGYDRGPPLPLERYRDVGGYDRDPYMAYQGRGRGFDPRDLRDEPPYNQSRDSRGSYQDYPPIATENRSRDVYPARGPPPLDYRRTSYEDRYPRAPPVGLDPPRGIDEGYRDSPARSFDYGQKRRHDGGYVDQYGGDTGVHL